MPNEREAEIGKPFSAFCVYTIRHGQALKDVCHRGGVEDFTENTPWKTSQALFLEAKKSKRSMPVIFTSADVTDKLIYCAPSSDVEMKQTPP